VSNFFLNFPIDKSVKHISHAHNLTFLGSCFSNEISSLALESGFRVNSNPFGTIFHPIPLAENVIQVIDNKNQNDFLERDGKYYSWNASTTIFGQSPEDLHRNIQAKTATLRNHLSEPGFVFVTFGSAFYYELKENNKIVANCHKQPNQFFEKKLSEVEELVEVWINVIENLRMFNSKLNVVFTVSPVRHIRDGLVENNRSKGRLIQLVEKICKESGSTYFPSYEIVIDELRDYRFFKQDRIHPNEEAISYVWNRFSEKYFDDQTKLVISDFFQVRKRLAHRSEINGIVDNRLLELKSKLEREFPWVQW
jgi:hypothetical protein